MCATLFWLLANEENRQDSGHHQLARLLSPLMPYAHGSNPQGTGS